MIVIILLLFGVFVAYTFIGFQTSKFYYAADFDYVMFKFRVLLGTIALGYFSAILSNFHDKLPLIGNYVNALANVVAVDFVRNLVALISMIWITFALAMLPFNHTVFNAEDGSINEERTTSLTKLHQLVYGMPFYVLFVIFSLNLFFFIVAICVRNDDTEDWKDGPDGWTKYPPLIKLSANWKNIRPTLGFHFYVPTETDETGGGGEGIVSNVSWFKW